MTIKELEEALGMPRASIRFYEQEGLLSPARSPNGYRDYSGEDLETLKKIKLLRELDVDLETIRALQAGEQNLSQVLKDRLTRMKEDENALAGAQEVCSQLRGEWLSYESLEAGPWLEKLKESPTPKKPSPPPARKPVHPDPFLHPWRRYFARGLDLSLYQMVIVGVLLLGFRIPFRALTGDFTVFLLGWLANIPMLLLEPFMLSRWGTTPGKAVFGITVRDSSGEKLTLYQARERTWEVFGRGMGYGIPLYEIWREFQSWRNCHFWEHNDWEIWGFENAERMDIPDGSRWCLFGVGAHIAGILLVMLMIFQSWMPPHKTIRTEQDFYDNYNFYGLQYGYGWTSWADKDTGWGLLESDGRSRYVEEDWSREPVGGQWTALRDEAGEITGFRCETWGNYTHIWVTNVLNHEQGVVAWTGPQPGVDWINRRPRIWLEELPDTPNFDVTFQDVRVIQRIRYMDTGEPVELENIGKDRDRLMELEFIVQRADM